MSEVREDAVLDAPVSTVWELVGDPRRYPEWFPRVFEIQGQRFEEGVSFVQVSRQPLIGRDGPMGCPKGRRISRVRLPEQLDGECLVSECAHDGRAPERVGAEHPRPPHRT